MKGIEMRKLKEPDIIVRRGKRIAVVLSLDGYQEILERLGDDDGLQWLSEARKHRLK
jgi:hypothetical protein